MIEPVDTGGRKVLIRGARILDTVSGCLTSPMDVLVNGDTIEDIDCTGPARGVHIIDGDGLTLAPGLIDCHCHVLSPFLVEQKGMMGTWALRQIRRTFAAMLACGVVCAKDMLSPIKIINHYRRAIEKGRMHGPRILAAGPILTAHGGYPDFINKLSFPAALFTGQPRIDIDSPQRASSVIRYLQSKGIDFVKVGYAMESLHLDSTCRLNVVSHDIMREICTTAHSLDLKVSVHIGGTADIQELLVHDIDSLEHLPIDRQLTPQEAEAIRQHGATVVPTLTITESSFRFEDKMEFLESRHASSMFEPQVLSHLKSVAAAWLDFSDPDHLKSIGKTRANRDMAKILFGNVKSLVRAGVRICAGTDMGAAISFPGETIDEMKRLKLAGLSTIEAIRSATLHAAGFIGLGNKLGSIETGAYADMLLIEGNPLDDIDAFRHIRTIGCRGRWYTPAFPHTPDYWNERGLLQEILECT